MSGPDKPSPAAGRRGNNRHRARLVATAVFVAAITVGYLLHVGIGNACGIGFLDVALVCPLGSLAAMIAARAAMPQAIVSLAVFVVVVLVVGRAFCGWLCPVPPLQRLLPGLNVSVAERERRRAAKARKRAQYERRIALEEAREQGRELSEAEIDAIVAKKLGTSATKNAPRNHETNGAGPTSPTHSTLTSEERAEMAHEMGFASTKGHSRFGSATVVLLIVLVTTALFGFPVFCLVCPVGLTFAFILLLIRLFVFGELTWALIAFPAVVLAEVMLLPKWCRHICPLGALHSLVANGNMTFRPHVDTSTCLHATKGAACGRCAKTCPQGISLERTNGVVTAINTCTKCGLCADACPSNSITFPFRPPKET